MKSNAEKKRAWVSLQVGDTVMVKLQTYGQHSIALRKNQKLSMKYFGPFKVLAKIGTVAFKLELSSTTRIYPIFHVAQLKLFKGPTSEPYMPLPLTVSEMEHIMQRIQVLATRTIIKGSRQVPQIVVQWENNLQEEAMWEDVEVMAASYLTFNLEDKVILKGDGNVTKEKPRDEKEGETSMNNKLSQIQEMRHEKREIKTNWKILQSRWDGQQAGLGGFGPKSLTHPNPWLSRISSFSSIFVIGLDGLG
ncbi:hypothetical protein KIW84_057084 [Lathyrus oleraceus]|uniref:Tf2-1-like SH3-like domain-containing protein n=1 Tax=Pisum sativum TaxID=3888 RepID=A0A9D5AHN7_PEA|nr:hypothetical protein KIW84_057084 [Pisum sativum]